MAISDDTMLAMRLEAPNAPLRKARVQIPIPNENEILIKVAACGVCRTDLHIVDGDLPVLRLPLTLGHEIVGAVVRAGASAVAALAVGQRVGVPWLAGTCRHCAYCGSGRENLCDQAAFTGYGRDGGFAEYVVADARYCFTLPENYDDTHAAPLLCAGLIGYRPGDARSQAFALSLGAAWAGGSDAAPPVLLDAAIIFAPEGALVPRALGATCKGATAVCAGIHMRDIPGFPYALLWGERPVRSVANLTRADGEAFFALAAKTDIRTVPVVFRLEQANDALSALRSGLFDGAAVLVPDPLS